MGAGKCHQRLPLRVGEIGVASHHLSVVEHTAPAIAPQRCCGVVTGSGVGDPADEAFGDGRMLRIAARPVVTVRAQPSTACSVGNTGSEASAALVGHGHGPPCYRAQPGGGALTVNGPRGSSFPRRRVAGSFGAADE
jgi:hypothetical protein